MDIREKMQMFLDFWKAEEKRFAQIVAKNPSLIERIYFETAKSNVVLLNEEKWGTIYPTGFSLLRATTIRKYFLTNRVFGF